MPVALGQRQLLGSSGADQFIGECTSAVNLAQSLKNRGGVDGNGAVVVGVESVLATRGMDVAIKTIH